MIYRRATSTREAGTSHKEAVSLCPCLPTFFDTREGVGRLEVFRGGKFAFLLSCCWGARMVYCFAWLLCRTNMAKSHLVAIVQFRSREGEGGPVLHQMRF